MHLRLGVGAAQTSHALRRRGQVWELQYGGRTATVPHSKGMLDLAVLLARPRTDVHVLDLAQSQVVSGHSGPALDRAAVSGYRARLEALSAARLQASGDEDRLASIEAVAQWQRAEPTATAEPPSTTISAAKA